MRLPHRVDYHGVQWTFALGGVDRRNATGFSDDPDLVYVRFRCVDGRFGTISVRQSELPTLDDADLMRRVRETAHEKRSPDPITYGT